jgi:hypothetical protein
MGIRAMDWIGFEGGWLQVVDCLYVFRIQRELDPTNSFAFFLLFLVPYRNFCKEVTPQEANSTDFCRRIYPYGIIRERL